MPQVTATGRPLWEVYKRTAKREDKKTGKIKMVQRFHVGHEDGEFVETFAMEPIAKHFAKILNQRDEALELLAKATGKQQEVLGTGWRRITQDDVRESLVGKKFRIWAPFSRYETNNSPHIEYDPSMNESMYKIYKDKQVREVRYVRDKGYEGERSYRNIISCGNWDWPIEVVEIEA